jgi:hypothetical protein
MAAENLFSRYVDRAALEAETKFVLDNLRKVFDAFNGLSSAKVDLNFAKGSEQLFSTLQKTNTELEKAAKVSDREAAAVLKLARAKTEEAKARKTNADAAGRESKTTDKNLKNTTEEAKAALLVSRAKTEEAKQRDINARAAANEEKAQVSNSY